MDEKTRGQIENALDYMIDRLNIRDITDWIFEGYQIKSFEDLAIGYVLGSFSRYAHDVIRQEKISKSIMRETEAKLGKEKAKELLKRLEKRDEDTKPIRVALTEKDTAEIRDLLRRRFLDIIDRINRELNR